ncbi:MAG: hypothetical protein K6U09_06215 [Acidobacteriia bacterium]|jgi:hypothetical protein|nr:hypothetical protein [Terriglobia bacterium]
MSEALLYGLLAAALLALLTGLLRALAVPAATAPAPIERLLPRHPQYFPALRPSLQTADGEFLRGRLPREEFLRWRAERRRILRGFLAGLNQDCRHLTQLARTVARLSPRVSRRSELQLLQLQVSFRLLYGLAWLRVSLNVAALRNVSELTYRVGRLAAQVEAAMLALESSSRLRPDPRLNG